MEPDLGPVLGHGADGGNPVDGPDIHRHQANLQRRSGDHRPPDRHDPGHPPAEHGRGGEPYPHPDLSDHTPIDAPLRRQPKSPATGAGRRGGAPASPPERRPPRPPPPASATPEP